MVRHVDAKGNGYSLEYDKLGRVTKEEQFSVSGIQNTKTYSYDPASFSGVLEKVSQTERRSSVRYTYDAHGRVTEETEIFYTSAEETDSVTVAFETTYDELGRISQREYPGGFTVDYRYNPYGDLEYLEAQGQTLWRCDEVNALGQITAYTMADKQTTVCYNTYGELTSMDLSGERSMSFSFDDFGNLSSRTRNDVAFSDIRYLVSKATGHIYLMQKIPYDNGLYSLEKGFVGIEKQNVENDLTDYTTETEYTFDLDRANKQKDKYSGTGKRRFNCSRNPPGFFYGMSFRRSRISLSVRLSRSDLS